MFFRHFLHEDEHIKATELIATIDLGEKWIFTGADGSDDFEGFIDHLYFSGDENYGTFSSCAYNGKLRIHIGFKYDMPDYLNSEILSLIIKAREKVNSFTSIWYDSNIQKIK